MGEITLKLRKERRQTGPHHLLNFFVALTALNGGVESVLDKNLDQRLAMQLLGQLFLLNLQPPLEQLQQPVGIILEDLLHIHFGRPAGPDDHDATGHLDFALGERIEGCHGPRGILLRLQLDFHLHRARRVIADAPELDLPLARGLFNGGNQGIGVGPEWHRTHHQGLGVTDLDRRPDADIPLALVVTGHIHHAALQEIGVDLKRPLLKDGHLGLQQFIEVMRQDAGG